MRADRPSLTAAAVAVAREVSASSPETRAMLPPLVAGATQLWASVAHHRSLQLAPRLLSGGLVDHLRLRTAAIDAALTAAVAGAQGGRPCQQVVLLGAGLDARAYRLAALQDATVWEVDHPATQAAKLRRARAVEPRAAAVHHVAVDFAVEDLASRLAEAGLRKERATAWVWEGVTMYLPAEATRASLAAMAACSGPGSVLIMSYMVPQLLPTDWAVAATQRWFARLGEPLVGAMDPDEAAARVAAVGGVTRGDGFSDTGAREWAAAYGGSWRMSTLWHAERLLVAPLGGGRDEPAPAVLRSSAPTSEVS